MVHIKSFEVFFNFFKRSTDEILKNFKIYSIYIIALSFAAIAQNYLNFLFLKNDLVLSSLSKILFSIVPLLILSKILYVIKIRHTGIGDFKRLLIYFLLYNFYYFVLFFVAFFIYLLPAIIMSNILHSPIGFVALSFLLLPLIYIIIYFSLTPFVAAYENDSELNHFKTSKKISTRNITLVIINHFFSLAVPLISSLFSLINSPAKKLIVMSAFSPIEATLSIIMVLTTSKIYFYLIDLE